MSIVAREGPVFACHNGWHAGNHTGRPTCYRVTDEKVPSLRGCVARCLAEASAGLEIDGGSDSGGRLTTQAAPVCIETEEENAFLTSLVRGFTWTGLYQNGSTEVFGEDAGYDDGWGRCVTGDAPNTSAWAVHDSTRANFYGPEDCMVLGPDGLWHDTTCNAEGTLLPSFPCLCESPSIASAAFEDDIARLEANWQLWADAQRPLRVVLFSLAPGLIPPILFVLYKLCRTAALAWAQQALGKTDDDKGARVRLVAAQRSAASVRLRVTFFLLTVGFFAVSVGFGVTVSNSTLPWSSPAQAFLGPQGVWTAAVFPGLMMMFLAILPTDGAAIRVCCCLMCVMIGLVTLIQGNIVVRAALGLVSYSTVEFIVFGISAGVSLSTFLMLTPTVFCTCCSCCRACAMQSRPALLRLWMAVRWYTFATGTTRLAIPLYFTAEAGGLRVASWPNFIADEPNDGAGAMVLGATLVFASFLTTPKMRGVIRRRLIALGRTGSAAQEAAAVAALLGGGSVDDALKTGKQRFRALPLSKLELADLMSNEDTGLYQRTVEANYGEVDAFVTHSWSDDGAAKFKQLQTWGDEVRKENGGQEPLIWLDKVPAPARRPRCRHPIADAPRSPAGVHQSDEHRRRSEGAPRLPLGLQVARRLAGQDVLEAAVVRRRRPAPRSRRV